jgi:hypothetical protein
MANELLRKASSPDYYSQWPEIQDENISAREGRPLKEALLGALHRSSDPQFEDAVLSALCGCHDEDLLPLWVEYLTKHLAQLKSANGVVHNILVTLWQMGEINRKTNDSGGRSLMDVELNIEEANEYLKKRGVAIHW